MAVTLETKSKVDNFSFSAKTKRHAKIMALVCVFIRDFTESSDNEEAQNNAFLYVIQKLSDIINETEKAAYKNGVLRIELQRSENQRRREIRIEG